VLFLSDKSPPSMTLVALVTNIGLIFVADVAQDQFCALAWAKTTESSVRGIVDEAWAEGLTPIPPFALKRRVLVHT